MKKRYLVSVVAISIGLLVLDYINFPNFVGLKTSNINWDFSMGILNLIVVISLYFFTYKILDAKAVKREQNKNDMAILLLKNCYNECKQYESMLTSETVEKYVVPKVDFNSIVYEGSVIHNLENAPFVNETTIVDLAKDGQLTREQIEGYFKVKKAFGHYINMRITFFDAPEIYKPIINQLHSTVSEELEKLNKKV